MKYASISRLTLAALAVAVIGFFGTVSTASAAGYGHQKRGQHYGKSYGHKQSYKAYRYRGRPYYRGNYRPRGFGYRPRGDHYRHGHYAGHYVLPLAFIIGSLFDHGYQTVHHVQYYGPNYWAARNHGGRAADYKNGAYVARVTGPKGGTRLVHLDPYSGKTIRRVGAGRTR